MAWTAASGNTYKLCLLDTNALSEIVKMQNESALGFLRLFGPTAYAPCLTIYNLIELRRRSDLFDSFLQFFSAYPIFFLKPNQLIFQDEKKSPELSSDSIILNAFSALGTTESYDIRLFVERLFNLPEIASLENKWRKHEEDTLKAWLSLRKNFDPQSKMVNSRDAERYLSEAGIQTLIQIDPQWVKKELDANRTPHIDDFPSVKAMLYSQYYRFFDFNRHHMPQDVTDVRIMACAPYVDVIVTENFQAEVFRKVIRSWSRINHLEIATLKDLRMHSLD